MGRISIRTVMLAGVVWLVIALFFTSVNQPAYFAAFIGSMAGGGALMLAALAIWGRKIVRSGRVRPTVAEFVWLLGLVAATTVLSLAVARGYWNLHAGVMVLGVLIATATAGNGI